MTGTIAVRSLFGQQSVKQNCVFSLYFAGSKMSGNASIQRHVCSSSFLCYGIHEHLNLVVGPEGFPAALLIRSVHDVHGPGRLTKRLDIGRALIGKTSEPASGLHLEDDGVIIPKKRILWHRGSA